MIVRSMAKPAMGMITVIIMSVSRIIIAPRCLILERQIEGIFPPM
jgi:hypothetical protein